MRSSCVLSLHAPLVEGREPRHLTLGRLTAPLRHRADEREFLRRQQLGALATAPDHLARVVIVSGSRCDLRRFTTSGELDHVRQVVQVEVGRAQHAPQSLSGSGNLAGLVGSEQPQQLRDRRSFPSPSSARPRTPSRWLSSRTSVQRSERDRRRYFSRNRSVCGVSAPAAPSSTTTKRVRAVPSRARSIASGCLEFWSACDMTCACWPFVPGCSPDEVGGATRSRTSGTCAVW